jgi:amino acid transporter
MCLMARSAGFSPFGLQARTTNQGKAVSKSLNGMTDPVEKRNDLTEDERTLHRLGYAQELHRGMSAFSNFAISFSIICIVAGGVTSFHIGFCSVGGAAIGFGWPLFCLFSLVVALTMAQAASAFPTAGGLYHWASILGGKGWGWMTAWFNLAGLITVLAAINVGCWQFVIGSLGPAFRYDPQSVDPGAKFWTQIAAVTVITVSQALFNHFGIRLATRLTDAGGYLILILTMTLTIAMLAYASTFDFARLITFTNYSGLGPDPCGIVWPRTEHVALLFAIGLLLPAYTMTGFDASAHTAEETIAAAQLAPRGIVRSVLVSGLFGWLMLSAIILAVPDMDTAARMGDGVFYWVAGAVLPRDLALPLYVGIAVAQYLAGLATVTSASRMVYAFARDGGLPASGTLRLVHANYRTPVPAIWAVAFLALAFTVYTPVYSTITSVCAIFLYISYVLPAALGLWAYGRTWTKMGPWNLGTLYRPLAALCVVGCAALVYIGVQPPNDKALSCLVGFVLLMAVTWFAFERQRFKGPPQSARLRPSDSPH